MEKANRNVFIGATYDYDRAKVVLFGAGADATTSYRPGTRFGPAAIRAESYGIETYSPYQDRDLEDFPFYDSGDLEFPFGSPARQLEAIETRAGEILDDGKIPFMLGGEHLVTLGAVRAAFKRFPGLRIIHFDAHADLREEYLGETLSHATVMRRCYDLLGDGRIFQFGIRSGTREEFAFMKAGHVIAEKFTCKGVEKLSWNSAEKLSCCDVSTPQRLSVSTPVYLTIDLDVLDPADFPGTGTQEAGGLHYDELRCAITDILTRFHVVALDNVELNPSLDPSGRSTALACKFLRECLLALSGAAGRWFPQNDQCDKSVPA
ncbi:MAG: agmatinase [Kiritimatiellae bacterium]|nr:agmatinase [Kiritimatiellia bacterium]